MSVPPCEASIRIDVGAQDVGRGRRRCLALLRCLVDDAAHICLDPYDGVLGHAELLQAAAIKRNVIVLISGLKLAVGSIFSRIGVGMTSFPASEVIDL